MENFEFKYLIGKLVDGSITHAEFTELKEKIESASDNEIDTQLLWLWNNTPHPFKMDDKTRLDIISNITNQAAIVQPKRRIFPWKYVAAAIPLFILLGFWGHILLFKSDVQNFKVIADPGHKTKLELPDGSHVMLNSASNLTYNSEYNQESRDVILEGEAFFDISKNQSKNFTVSLGDIEIEVKGTRFNISAYKEDDAINISLVEGKIAVNCAKTHQVLTDMNPNEKVIYHKNTQQWELTTVDSELEYLWTKNTLRFEGASYEKVIEKLEKWYGMRIIVNNAPSKPLYYGFTIKGETLDETLRLMNQISPIKYEIRGEEVWMTYR